MHRLEPVKPEIRPWIKPLACDLFR